MTEKMQLSVCPHDTAKHMVEWFYFNTYLQRRLGRAIHFEPQDNFLIERKAVLDGGYHVVYANPFSACAFIEQLGFLPVAKPVGLYDETILVAPAGCAGLPARRPLRVASASDKLIIHVLGLSLLDGLGVKPDQCQFSLAGNHMKAAHQVLKGEADVAFVFNETWHSMSEASRAEFSVIGESEDSIAFHCFCIAPELAEHKVEIQALLAGMGEDPKGRSILQSLDFEGIEPLSDDAMDTLQTLMVYYNTILADASV